MDDTITAISTPLGEGGIGIVRMSGPEAISIADQIFRPKAPSSPNQAPSRFTLSSVSSHTVHYGRILDPVGGEEMDEVLLVVMRKPKTYTTEDIAEIHCHGGLLPLSRVLDLTLRCGARLAERGEFTKRAFLNGRLDLSQAESVLDIIRSKTKEGLDSALSIHHGALSEEIRSLKEKLVSLLVLIEAELEFPEDEIEELQETELLDRILELRKGLEKMIEEGKAGKILREGITAVIVGKTNVGKSSLLNALLLEDRAIVTSIPGTTRDTLEEWMNLKGIPVKLIDTAGIRETQDIVEREGVKRTKKAIEMADILLYLLDSSDRLTPDDLKIFDEVRGKKFLLLLNKCDLPKDEKLVKWLNGDFKKITNHQSPITNHKSRIYEISATQRMGLEELRKGMLELVWGNGVSPKEVVVNRSRHLDALRRSCLALEKADEVVRGGKTPELIAFEVRESLDALGEITGETAPDEILNRIFEEFCVGK
ncbi:tRNA uridine-5-carboxymethylaminomethyl(34) synthesis GTPase MnmE [candidate division TA06 bacterium]|nr:tRNA uridine-5-carboxymethylaminomethyl(34) synthesis GTPase MnmE [candidate division TA06 bacterium]